MAVNSTTNGRGYWRAAADGGVFSYGDAHFEGSLGATDVTKHILGIAATPDGKGYWLVSATGIVTAFGDAKSQRRLPLQRHGPA